MLINSFKAALFFHVIFFMKLVNFLKPKFLLCHNLKRVWENQPTGQEATFHFLPMSLQMFPSLSLPLSLRSFDTDWSSAQKCFKKKIPKKKTSNRLKGSSRSTVKAAGRCAQPCPRLCHCLSHLHLARTGSVLCPGTVPKKLLWMNSPRWLSSLHAVTSPRSPALLLVTHSAPGDR